MGKPVRIEQHGGLGAVWFIGWLFSIGFLKLGFWKGLLALIIWPYFLGANFAALETAQPEQIVQSDTE
ncbi:MAG: hypothetical protein ACE5FO_13225 [Parvularculaceae bacterium]